MNKTLQIANGVALIFTIVMNYQSNTGVFNGNTMKTVSDRYENYFTPASYAFSIWGLIYLALLGFVFYTGRSLFSQNNSREDDVVVEKVGWWFVLSCVCNAFWVVAWLYDYTGASVIIMAVLLFSLIQIILKLRMELDYHPAKKYVFIYWPFAFYSGWITVAVIANIAAWLTKINWDGWGISAATWTITMIIIAGILNLLMIWKRNLREFALVGIWGLIAIAISNRGQSDAIVYTCYVVAAIILAGIILSGSKNRNASMNGM